MARTAWAVHGIGADTIVHTTVLGDIAHIGTDGDTATGAATDISILGTMTHGITEDGTMADGMTHGTTEDGTTHGTTEDIMDGTVHTTAIISIMDGMIHFITTTDLDMATYLQVQSKIRTGTMARERIQTEAV